MRMRAGNAAAFVNRYAKRKGWFIGHFITERGRGDPGRTSDVEVKWGVHQKEEPKGKWTSDAATTMSILVRGRFRITFGEARAAPKGRADAGPPQVKPSTVRKRVLRKPGDYAIWGPGVAHTWAALENDTVVLTVRWPSRRPPTTQVTGPRRAAPAPSRRGR